MRFKSASGSRDPVMTDAVRGTTPTCTPGDDFEPLPCVFHPVADTTPDHRATIAALVGLVALDPATVRVADPPRA
jgi:hypothetical protein